MLVVLNGLIIQCCLLISYSFALRPAFLHRGHSNKALNTGYQYKTKYFQQKGRLSLVLCGKGSTTMKRRAFEKIVEKGVSFTNGFSLIEYKIKSFDTYQQRYLIADQYWNRDGGPIFFYTGNEGDIAWFCNNTGFMWDIAGEFKALLVFAEHRYYGESIPYGPEAYKHGEQLNYLTSEQALADFAVLIEHLKSTIPGAKNSSVIAFGGSYGGMLSAWLRIKYPNVVVGSLAASAPIWQFTGITPCEAFNEVLTKGFMKESKQCVDNIRNSWKEINDLGEITEGRNFITTEFKLCAPLQSRDDVSSFKAWLTNAWTDLAMVNYPYPANFLEPLPGWPVKEVCKKLATQRGGQQLITDLAKAVNIYFNYTGQASCLNMSQQATSDLGDLGWGYQSCTEMVMPICANGLMDMFEPQSWNFTSFSEECRMQWQTTPGENWITTEYWGKDIQGASNIIFSNGLLDPWSSGGVLESTSQSLVPIIIPDGAHHLDLRASNPMDPPTVINARTQEKNIMRMWLGLQDTSTEEEVGAKEHKLSKMFLRKLNKNELSRNVLEMNQN